MSAKTRRSLFHCCCEAVLRQAHLGETIITAIEFAQAGGHPHIVNTLYFTDPGIKIDGFEVATTQTATLVAESIQSLTKPKANAASRSKI